MKSLFRTIFLLIAFASIVGIIFIAIYYINKNIKLFKTLFQEVSADIEDFDLDSVEIVKIADKASAIPTKISKDITKDFEQTKSKVKNTIGEVVSNLDSEVELATLKPQRKNQKSEKGKLNARQTEVFNYIKLNPEAKMSSISKIFNKVTPRTLRRDLEKLEQMGFLKQEGKTRDAIYKIL